MPLSRLLLILLLACPATNAQQGDDTRLGRVLGTPVMASSVVHAQGFEREQELRALFVGPLLQHWWDEHPELASPTDADRAKWRECERKLVDAAAAQPASSSGALAEPTPRAVMDLLLKRWKQEQALYRTFGGGRILFQQFGLEAYDAMRRFLEQAEKDGSLSFDDDDTRKEVFAYWTLRDDDWRINGDADTATYFDAPPVCSFAADAEARN